MAAASRSDAIEPDRDIPQKVRHSARVSTLLAKIRFRSVASCTRHTHDVLGKIGSIGDTGTVVVTSPAGTLAVSPNIGVATVVIVMDRDV